MDKNLVVQMTDHTSLSLLDRLKLEPQGSDWTRFVDVYDPLLRNWLRRHAVLFHDSDDVVQSVMAIVVRRVSEFEHNGRPGAFRTWLRMITFNCLKEHWRHRKASPTAAGGSDAHNRLAELEDPNSQLSREWNAEHDRQVMRKLLELLKDEFDVKTWLAFQRVALEGLAASEVASQLEMTTNAVYIAKSRVLARLRQESNGLLDP